MKHLTSINKDTKAMNSAKIAGVCSLGLILALLSGLWDGFGLKGESSGGLVLAATAAVTDADMPEPATQSADKRDLVVTRVFDAPVELVWKAWSDSEQVKRWWGPTGFTAPVARIDFREGGKSLVCMRSPDGQDFYNTWSYTRIVPMKRIEFTLDWADKDGNRVDPATMGLPPNLPRDVLHLITFKAVADGKTELTVAEYGYTSDQIFDLSKAGLEQCLDKMAASFRKP
jgi:uncharacterized protein YndB with AHSA1/START domain